jgi:CBS domain-containing protein
MKVSEIMTKHPVTVTPDQSLQEAAEIMARIESGFIPVGENDKLIGMLTDRDIVVRGMAKGVGPESRVRDVMTKEVRYCSVDDDTDSVAANMGEQQIRRLPVVDGDKRLVGILSLGDLAAQGQANAAGAALEDIVQPTH